MNLFEAFMTIKMEDPITVAMIDRWIADYYSHLVWKQFEKDDCILSPWVRDYISTDHIIALEVLDDKEGTLTPEMNPRLLIDFMYKVSYGEKLFEDSDRTGHTLLEEAIEILDRILNVDKLHNRLDRDSFLHLKLLLRQQAVMVCCKKNEFDLANEVFGRVWRHWKNQNEMEVRQKMWNVIEQRNSDHGYFDLMPYSSLIDGARTVLCEIFSSLKTPFLVTAAQSVYSNYSSIMQKSSFLKGQNLSNDIMQASNSSKEDAGTRNSTTSNNIKPNQMENIRSGETETGVRFCTADEPEEITDSEVTVSADTLKYGSLQMNSLETDIAEGSKDVGKSARKFKDECSNSSRTESKMNDNEKDSPTSNLKRKCEELNLKLLDWEDELSSTALPSLEPKLRKFWQPKEEERLYLGVQKYGVGQWRQVANFLGSSRSNIDVKDKWRTMTKQGKLKTYQKQFGPVVT